MAIPVQESSGRLQVLGDLSPPRGAGLWQEETGYPGAESEEKKWTETSRQLWASP